MRVMGGVLHRAPRRAGRRRQRCPARYQCQQPAQPSTLLIIELTVLGAVVVTVAYLVATL